MHGFALATLRTCCPHAIGEWPKSGAFKMVGQVMLQLRHTRRNEALRSVNQGLPEQPHSASGTALLPLLLHWPVPTGWSGASPYSCKPTKIEPADAARRLLPDRGFDEAAGERGSYSRRDTTYSRARLPFRCEALGWSPEVPGMALHRQVQTAFGKHGVPRVH